MFFMMRWNTAPNIVRLSFGNIRIPPKKTSSEILWGHHSKAFSLSLALTLQFRSFWIGFSWATKALNCKWGSTCRCFGPRNGFMTRACFSAFTNLKFCESLAQVHWIWNARWYWVEAFQVGDGLSSGRFDDFTRNLHTALNHWLFYLRIWLDPACCW